MVGGRSKSIGVTASVLACLALAAPAQAQFGGILGGAVRGGANAAADTDTDANGCPKGKKRSRGSRLAGGILGGIASSAAGQVGGVLNYVPVAEFSDQISASIACKLDPAEQAQAAEATLEATRSATDGDAQVGSTVAWTSNTRENVSGTSTVVARSDQDNNGMQCIMVTDVVIVNGEEARADKRMCRRPPAARYAIAA
jgi:surface antigen